MIFKSGTFHGETPERILPQDAAALEASVAAALAAAGSIDASDLSVTSQNGHIVLSGSVQSEAEAAEAADIALSVDGVDVVEVKISTAS